MFNKTINKILVIRLSSLGDILLTTPIIRALRRKYSGAQIDFILKKQYKETLEYNPHINKVIIYEKESAKKLNNELRFTNYDLIVDLHNNYRSRTLTHGLKGDIFRFRKPTIKKLLLVWSKINLLKELKSIPQRYAETAGVDLDETGLELIVPQNICSKLEDGKKYIGFCPGAKHFTKRWLPEYFIELGNKLNMLGYTVVLFGGQSDKELCEEIFKQINNCINLQNSDNLLQTAVDMKRCKLVLTNDSGLMHASSAIGAPVVAVFGSTVREFGFTPYGTKNLILENKLLTCRPCSHIGKSVCPKKHFRCMKEIKPEFVLDNLKTFLAGI